MTPTITRAQLPPDVQRAIHRYEIAVAQFAPGRDASYVIELPLLEAATALMRALGVETLAGAYQGRATLPQVKARPAKVLSPRRRTDRRVAR